jgi:hypothetical protein
MAATAFPSLLVFVALVGFVVAELALRFGA